MVVPSPRRLEAEMLPPCASVMDLAMASPSPDSFSWARAGSAHRSGEDATSSSSVARFCLPGRSKTLQERGDARHFSDSALNVSYSQRGFEEDLRPQGPFRPHPDGQGDNHPSVRVTCARLLRETAREIENLGLAPVLHLERTFAAKLFERRPYQTLLEGNARPHIAPARE